MSRRQLQSSPAEVLARQLVEVVVVPNATAPAVFATAVSTPYAVPLVSFSAAIVGVSDVVIDMPAPSNAIIGVDPMVVESTAVTSRRGSIEIPEIRVGSFHNVINNVYQSSMLRNVGDTRVTSAGCDSAPLSARKTPRMRRLERVLAADDSKLSRDILERLLMQLGCI